MSSLKKDKDYDLYSSILSNLSQHSGDNQVIFGSKPSGLSPSFDTCSSKVLIGNKFIFIKMISVNLQNGECSSAIKSHIQHSSINTSPKSISPSSKSNSPASKSNSLSSGGSNSSSSPPYISPFNTSSFSPHQQSLLLSPSFPSFSSNYQPFQYGDNFFNYPYMISNNNNLSPLPIYPYSYDPINVNLPLLSSENNKSNDVPFASETNPSLIGNNDAYGPVTSSSATIPTHKVIIIYYYLLLLFIDIAIFFSLI
jgi:hypothetical protein